MVTANQSLVKEINVLEKIGFLDKGHSLDAPQEHKEMALRVYSNFMREGESHQCYWNDRFYLANRFGLDIKLKQESALNSVVANGLSGYFEKLTHSGFDNFNLLYKMGIPIFPGELLDNISQYTFLDGRTIVAVVKNLGLDKCSREELEEMHRGYNHSNHFRLDITKLFFKI